MKWSILATAFLVSACGSTAWGQAQAVLVPAGPPLVGPAQMYVQPPQPVTTYYAPTVTALYPPTTIWNWWRPRPVVAYYGGSVMAAPAVIPAAPVVAARPVTAYYPPVATVAPTTTYYPSASYLPNTTYYPNSATTAAPAMAPVPAAPTTTYLPAQPATGPTVVYRPIIAPSQAYLYSRGPLGFPRVDAVPVATPALVPVVIP